MTAVNRIGYLVLALAATSGAYAQGKGEHWVATWGTAQTLVRAGGRGPQPAPGRGSPATPPPQPAAPPKGPARRFGIPPPLAGLKNQTIRMVARTSIGGRSVRIRLSNALNGATVVVGSAHIALRGKESAVAPGSDRALTFSGKPSATLYSGQMLVSDPVNLELPPLADVLVSLYFPGETGPPTSHTFALQTTYISREGDHAGDAEITDPEGTRESWYWLAGIDVLAPASAGTLVTFGDSITDGDQSTPGTNGAWPAVLAARLQRNKATRNVAMVNAGISGNRVLGDNGSALARLMHDVLSQPGIRWMTVLEGINDITGATRGGGPPTLTAEDLIAAYRQIIETAHLYGVKVFGCTLTPYGGSPVYTEAGEAIRDAVNQWIRKSGAFDGVIDFDAATRDPGDPKKFRAAADSPDLLHPANPGYALMAEAVDLGIFK